MNLLGVLYEPIFFIFLLLNFLHLLNIIFPQTLYNILILVLPLIGSIRPLRKGKICEGRGESHAINLYHYILPFLLGAYSFLLLFINNIKRGGWKITKTSLKGRFLVKE
jgi:hypothetical protein